MSEPSDRLSLLGMRWRATHGVLAHEKVEPQPFEVDVVVHADVATLAKVHTGHLDLTVALRAGGLKFEGPRPLVQALPVWLRHSPFADVLKPAHAG